MTMAPGWVPRPPPRLTGNARADDAARPACCDPAGVTLDNPPGWTAGAVAARLGVAPSTLRTWNRRYGVGPAEHATGRHRRYSDVDVSRLEAMCALVADGLAPAAAAQLVQNGKHPATGALPEERTPPVAVPQEAVQGLVSTVLRLDAPTVQRVLEQHFATVGVVGTWEALCVPTLTELGRRSESGSCVDAEHLFSWTLTGVLHRVAGPSPPGHSRGVLLACGPGERHTLALDALRAALAERGVLVRAFGADLPAAALIEAARRTRPVAIALWAQTERTARTALLAQAQSSPASAVIALGPGWARRRLQRGVLTADTLTTALLTILRACPGIVCKDLGPGASSLLKLGQSTS
jgi:DNA-binding transcriptional MerR regulator